jgi:hypothetical protein
MRSDHSSGFDRDSECDAVLNSNADHEHKRGEWDLVAVNSNSANEVFGELGLILVVVLGVVLAINMMLVALHVS